jgi:YHS domain-containing protein
MHRSPFYERETTALQPSTRCPGGGPDAWSPRRLAARIALAAAIATGFLVSGSAARATIDWHPDLAAAQSASAASGKPVLVVFEASWGDASGAGSDPLTSSEVEAVMSACFEVVRLDVDEHAERAREFGIEHVPAACVLDAEQQPLVSFECPESPAELVAAAARAAQVAAAAGPGPAVASLADGDGSEPLGLGTKPKASSTKLAVSNKVRQLSNFAEGGPSQPATTARYADASGSAFVGDAIREPATQPVYAAPPVTPTLSQTPPAWPAEAQPHSLTSFAPQPAPPQNPAIEPHQATATPWLAAANAQAADAGAEATDADAEAAALPEPPPTKAPSTTSSFLAALQKPWSIFSRTTPDPALAPPPPPTKMPPALPQWRAALVKAPATEADDHGPMPLGLEGYCPVTVVERGAWVEGRPQWGARHRGRTYLFAGPEQQKAFLADPDRYAPALSGDDPVLAFENGASQPGRRVFGVTYQSRMYLFTSPETRAAFTADPGRYTARVLIAEGLAPADGIRRF